MVLFKNNMLYPVKWFLICHALLYCTAAMRLLEKFQKTNMISLSAQFCENQTENISNKNQKNFLKIVCEILVHYQRTTAILICTRIQ